MHQILPPGDTWIRSDIVTATSAGSTRGLRLQPFRALRPAVDGADLARLLCPPYDVIDPAQRAALLDADADNAVAVILPEAPEGTDPYQAAADRLNGWVRDGRYVVDAQATLYVYEMRGGGATTRGLVGAVELRDPLDGVILPHENTMAGPVADRLALMTGTEANVEPIYLVYDGGGAASRAVGSVDSHAPLATATTPDGIEHRVWAITDAAVHAAVAEDLGARRALIADGHHRYATYRELQNRLRGERGDGPWDFGLTLLVDSSNYGPQVHAIHRVLRLPLADALHALPDWQMTVEDVESGEAGLTAIAGRHGFAAVLSDGVRSVVVADTAGRARAASMHEGETATLTDLDVTILHRGMVEQVWGLDDNVDTVGYAHSVDEAIEAARAQGGTAVLLRPTPVAAVTAVAAAGARMPRKSTLFTPKPASGLFMRRFADGD
jgi:uncharacterized protein (DUF1015 family)